MSHLQIGAQMYSVRDRCKNPQDMLAAMKSLKAMGYDICQLSGHNPEITAAQLKDMLDETGLTCCATHFGFDDIEANLDKYIADHKTLGCAYPGTGSLPARYRTSADGYIEFARRATAVADRMAEAGQHFLYHNHAFEFYRDPVSGKTGMELLMENCGPNVQFEIDVFWVQMGGCNPVDWIHKVKGRMDVVHFKEMNGTLENRNVIAPIGKGNLDWKSILKACEDTGVTYALIEQDNAVETDSLECMRQSHDYLAGIGGCFHKA